MSVQLYLPGEINKSIDKLLYWIDTSQHDKGLFKSFKYHNLSLMSDFQIYIPGHLPVFYLQKSARCDTHNHALIYLFMK